MPGQCIAEQFDGIGVASLTAGLSGLVGIHQQNCRQLNYWAIAQLRNISCRVRRFTKRLTRTKYYFVA